MNVCLIQKGRPICAMMGILGIVLALIGSGGRAADVDSCDEDTFRNLISTENLVTFSEDCEITLSAIEGPVIINRDVTIDAQGHNVTIIGDGTFRLFELQAANVNMYGLKLTNGHETNGGAFFIDADSTLVL